MNDLLKLADALDYLGQGADLLATERGLYRRDEGDMTRFDAVVTARLFTYGCAEIDADILYDDYGPDDGFKSYRKLRVCHGSDVVDSDDMDGYEFRKTLRGLYRNVFRDLIGQILDGKLAGAEDEAIGEARLPLHLLRNHSTGTLDVVDNDSAVIASFTDDEIIDVGREADATGAERGANLKGLVRDATIARVETLLNKIRGNGAESANDVQVTAERPAATPQEEGPAEAEAEKPKPTRTSGGGGGEAEAEAHKDEKAQNGQQGGLNMKIDISLNSIDEVRELLREFGWAPCKSAGLPTGWVSHPIADLTKQPPSVMTVATTENAHGCGSDPDVDNHFYGENKGADYGEAYARAESVASFIIKNLLDFEAWLDGRLSGDDDAAVERVRFHAEVAYDGRAISMRSLTEYRNADRCKVPREDGLVRKWELPDDDGLEGFEANVVRDCVRWACNELGIDVGEYLDKDEAPHDADNEEYE